MNLICGVNRSNCMPSRQFSSLFFPARNPDPTLTTTVRVGSDLPCEKQLEKLAAGSVEAEEIFGFDENGDRW